MHREPLALFVCRDEQGAFFAVSLFRNSDADLIVLVRVGIFGFHGRGALSAYGPFLTSVGCLNPCLGYRVGVSRLAANFRGFIPFFSPPFLPPSC